MGIKRLILLMLVSASVYAVDLSMSLKDWDGNPLVWQEIDGGLQTSMTAGTLLYTAAPLSEVCEVEAIVTVLERYQRSYAITGVGLVLDESNYFHVALVEKPVAAGAGHFCELNQRYQESWPYKENLEYSATEGDQQWKYGVPYRMKLSKTVDSITGTVETLDGKTLVFRKTAKFKDDTPARYVRPALRGGLTKAQFTAVKASWSGKTTQEETKAVFAPYQNDSFVAGRSVPATGFFQVKQDADGSWWSYDPLGRGFVVFCMGSVRFRGQTCERLGSRLLYEEHNLKAYKAHVDWEEETLARLKSWGFNTFNGDISLCGRGLAHQTFLGIGTVMASMGDEFDIAPYENRPCSAFPNVYHPKFRQWCVWRLKSLCTKDIGNPWLYGYFTDNELAWWGRGAADTGLFDLAMAKPAKHTAKIAVCRLLALKYAQMDLAKLNKTWNLKLTNWDDLLKVTKLPTATDEQRAIKLDFLRMTAEVYFKTIHDAFKEIDKNHLLLGCRCAGIDKNHPVVWEMMGKYSDVITWNSYIPVDLEAEVAYSDWTPNSKPLRESFETVYNIAKKPVLITEWSFPALDSGLPCTHGAGMRVRTQEERAKASEIYIKSLLSMPFVLGYNSFMWVDQPPLGVSLAFPENTNYGIVNIKGVPYEPLAKVFTEVQSNPAKYKNVPLPAPKAVKPARRELYDTYLKFPLGGEAKALTGMFDVTIGRFRVYRKDDGCRLYFDQDGRPQGSISAMMLYVNAEMRNRWEEAGRLMSVSMRKDGVRTELSMTARHVPAEGDALSAAFELDYRMVFIEGQDWMLWEITGVRNLGDKPIDMKGVYLRGFPNIDGRREVCDDTTYDPVPNLYAPVRYTGWVSPDAKRYLAFVGGYREPLTMRCWFDPKRGTYHPDLRYDWVYMLPPKADMKLPSPFYLAVLSGGGTLPDGFSKALELWK